MSSAEIVVFLGAVATMLTALAGVLVQLRRLEIRVDGRLSQLLELTRKSSHAEGMKDQLGETSGQASEMLSGHLPLDRT